MKRAPESFSTQRRALSAAGVVESKRVTNALPTNARSMSPRLRLETVGCEGSPARGLWRRSIITERKRSSGK